MSLVLPRCRASWLSSAKDWMPSAEKKVETALDYSKGLGTLPKSDVLKYLLEGNCFAVTRLSGTESKLKVYISVSGDYKQLAEAHKSRMCVAVAKFFRQKSGEMEMLVSIPVYKVKER